MKFTRNKVVAAALIIVILAVAFWYGGEAPGLQGFEVDSSINESNTVLESEQKNREENNLDEVGLNDDDKLKDDNLNKEQEELEEKIKATNVEVFEASVSEKAEETKELTVDELSTTVEKGSMDYSESQGMVIETETGKDKYLTDPVPEGKPVPVEPENVEILDVEYTCTLSVRCDTILNNMGFLDEEKVDLVPEDGIIFPTTEVTFYQGESVFNVLQREMKKAKIHLEFSNTPMYNSVYIEGINNLYEFDCGELSGWMYKVNNWFPNYGASRYQLKDGDVVEWLYTCELGADIGGYNE